MRAARNWAESARLLPVPGSPLSDGEDGLRRENARLREELERLRAGLATGAEELPLESLLPAFPALLFLFSPDDRYLAFRAGEGLFVPPSEFLGKRIDEVLPPPTGPAFRRFMQKAREAKGRLQTVEYSLPMPTEERHFEARILGLADDRVVILSLDVTDRHVAQETVRRQAEHLDHILRLSPAVIYSLRFAPGGLEVASVSENVRSVLGYAPQDLEPPGFWPRGVHPDDLAAAQEGAARALAEGHVVHRYRFRHADGRWRWIRDEMRLVLDAAGQPSELVGSLSDVTAQQEAEEQLRQSQERFRQVIEGSPDLLAIFDAAGRVAYASPSAVDLLGYPPDQLLGRPASDLVVAEDAARAEAVLGELAGAPGATRRIELRMKRADGSRLVFDSLVRNLLHVPSIGGFVVNARDVSQQRQLEGQVLQSQKLESIGRLAGGVAHDFNNLLIGILGYAQFLEEGIRAGNPSLEDLGEIRKAGERARDLTAQLLTVARRQASEQRVIDLNGVLQDSEKLLRRVIGEDIELAVQLEPRPWAIKADPGNLQQVLLNLAVNARDAMPRGGKLTLETANVDLDERYASGHQGVVPGRYLLLTVSDSGQGMSAEVQAHLFEPFFTTKAPGLGTGLGLATVHGIVKQSGGHIWVDSEVGRGTSFRIYLPRTDEVPARSSPDSHPRAHRGTEAVLVAEDEPSVRELIVRTLQGSGYRVLAASGGREALELAAQTLGELHLLLTDVVMPDLSGKALADQLLALRPGLRVLYMSGYTQNTIVHHGVLDPGVRFLPKPFVPASLLEAVRRALDEG